MKTLTAALALSLAALLPFAATPTFAATAGSQAELCLTAPAKASAQNIDCTATSSFDHDKYDAAKKYPDGPVTFSNGISF